ncbi:MAG: DUF3307 domain-containing protein [Gammaproteobacteria bacterium]|nr:DUF3307 domain-containing protein [Gammaproteobacteria bacterium]
MDILIKLLIAHLVADFLLQWRSLLQSKFNKKFASPYLYLHGLIHFLLTLLVLWNLSYWPAVAIIAVSHTIIDGLKVTLQNQRNQRALFFIDQLLHLIILYAVANYYQVIDITGLTQYPYLYAHLLFIIFLTFPTSIIIQILFLKWELPETINSSLSGAGSYIGIIERLMIYGAVITLNWGLIGFLLAAKSVFRFGDMRDAHDRKYTEYVFVGTLLSFMSAIVCGVLFMLYAGQTSLLFWPAN